MNDPFPHIFLLLRRDASSESYENSFSNHIGHLSSYNLYPEHMFVYQVCLGNLVKGRL